MLRILPYLFCLLTVIPVAAQEIDNTFSYKHIASDSYIRYSLDEDYLLGKDEQYTGGSNLEVVMPWVKKFPLTRLLIRPRFQHISYGIGLETNMYTPNYQSNEDKRPYAGTFFLKTLFIAIDSTKRRRFASTLSTGVIGPVALGYELQRDVHRCLGGQIPQGWANQVSNGVVLNYQANYEQQLLWYDHSLSLDASAVARAGTLSDKASLGLTLMTGYFESPFAIGNEHPGKLHVYLYDHPQVDFVAYDATLQGGAFNGHNPSVLPADQVSRVTFQNRGGIAVAYKRLTVEYFQSFLTRQYTTGSKHKWNGIQVAVNL
jgi:hypothetical protein